MYRRSQIPLNNPYYSICRPFTDGSYVQDTDIYYFLDPRFLPNGQHLVRAYSLLERDLQRLFDYVEPSEGNLTTHSHMLYQLLLRACTEIETNATSILFLNGYARKDGRKWTMKDYMKLEVACRLSEYQVRMPIWKGGSGVFTPFSRWAKSESLPWYQDYNNVKHDRFKQFEKANFVNVLNAISGLLVILYAQFDVLGLSELRMTYGFTENDGWMRDATGLFEVLRPTSWTDSEKYEFSWQTLKFNANPIREFAFKE